MDFPVNIKLEPQNTVSYANAQTGNLKRTKSNQNAVCLMTKGTLSSQDDMVPSLLQKKITDPNVKLNPVTFDLSAAGLNAGNANNIPVKYIIAANGAPPSQLSSEHSLSTGRILGGTHSFILGAAANNSSCQVSSEQVMNGYAVISVPSSSKRQEIAANGFTFVTTPANVLQIRESPAQSSTPIKFTMKPIVSHPPQSLSQQKVMFAAGQPSYPASQAVIRPGNSHLPLPTPAARLHILSNDGKFQFVKLVTTPKEGTLIATDVNSEPLKLLVSSPKTLPSKVVSVTPTLAQDKKRPIQRTILPATFQSKGSRDDSLASTSVLAADSSRIKLFKPLCTAQTESDRLLAKSAKKGLEVTSVQGSNHPKTTVVSNASDAVQKLRRPCNCSKSHCLKLYCECFAMGEFCSNCNCNHCLNNLENENHRQRAIRSCRNRNPQAFHPKIGKSHEGDIGRRHSKGCRCKRSGCLKNYCECYEAKIPCTDVCRCQGCKNFETSASRNSPMHFESAAEVKVQKQPTSTTVLDTRLEDVPRKSNVEHGLQRLPHAFVTLHVVDTISECLLETAEKWEQEKAKKREQEDATDADTSIIKLLLEEFGRCADRLISAAGMSNG